MNELVKVAVELLQKDASMWQKYKDVMDEALSGPLHRFATKEMKLGGRESMDHSVFRHMSNKNQLKFVADRNKSGKHKYIDPKHVELLQKSRSIARMKALAIHAPVVGGAIYLKNKKEQDQYEYAY